MLSENNWDDVVKFDRKYYMHNRYSADEWTPFPILGTEGNYVIDVHGRKILDLLHGYTVNAGHRNARILDAIRTALDHYDWVWETYLTPHRAEAAKLIIDNLLRGESWAGKARFVSTGSEAVEEALIVSKLFTQRPYVVTMDWSYHGWTEGAGSCTGFTASRNILTSPREKVVLEVPGHPAPGYYSIRAPFPYRCPHGPGCDDCDETTLNELENLIKRLGPKNVAAVITDIILGGVVVVLSKKLIQGLRRITRDYGIVWIDDEVITGFGRTGKWFCYQHYGVEPDIVVMAKGLSSGHLPAGGIIVGKEISNFFDQFRWWHWPSNAAHPVTTAAIVANIKFLIDENILERVETLGEYLETQLRKLQEKHRCVGFVSGMGLLWGIEVVKDRATKEPFVKDDRNAVGFGDLSRWPTNIISRRCLERYVLVSGFSPNTVRIAPPLTITREEIDKGLDALDYSLSELDGAAV